MSRFFFILVEIQNLDKNHYLNINLQYFYFDSQFYYSMNYGEEALVDSRQ